MAESLPARQKERVVGAGSLRNELFSKGTSAVNLHAEALAVAERMAVMVVGGEDRVRAGLQEIIDVTQADELIIASDAYAFEDRMRSFETIALAANLPRSID